MQPIILSSPSYSLLSPIERSRSLKCYNRFLRYSLLKIFAVYSIGIAGCIPPEHPPTASEIATRVFTDDGAWCWFQDPRAVYHEGVHRRTYTGWMTKDGRLQVGTYDHDTGSIESLTLKEEWDIDDHNTPSFLVLPGGRLTAFYARHNKVGLFARTTSRPEDISAWDSEVIVSNEDRITYSHPVRLSAERRTHLCILARSELETDVRLFRRRNKLV